MHLLYKQLVKTTHTDRIHCRFPEDCIQARHWNVHITIFLKSGRSILA
jgi:hypothetical protein